MVIVDGGTKRGGGGREGVCEGGEEGKRGCEGDGRGGDIVLGELGQKRPGRTRFPRCA